MGTVKLLTFDGGEPHDDSEYWHAIVRDWFGSRRTACGGEAFGCGESGCEFKERASMIVTCPRCIEYINGLRKYKLKELKK